MNVNPLPPTVSTRSAVVAHAHRGDKVVTYERNADGAVSGDADTVEERGWVERTRQKVWNSLVPENLSESVSKDYVVTRKWQLTRDFLGSFAGTASLAAVMTAVAPANAALAALSFTVANATWVKDRLGQLSSIASTNIARIAEKNPRPWLLAADLVNNVGTVVDASSAVLPPLAYYPLLTGVAVVKAVAGAAGGAANANVQPRQALKGNLGELAVKDANQGTLATFAGATAGIASLAAIGGAIGFAPAAVVVAGIGATGGLFAKYKMLQNLDYNPINEQALRRVEAEQASSGQVAGPDSNLGGQLLTLLRKDTLVAGEDARTLLEDPAFPALRQIFRERPYILSVRDGAPHLVMKHDQEAADLPPAASGTLPQQRDYSLKIAQVQAVYQGIKAEKLLASPQYQEKVQSLGQSQADLWVAQESLSQTPADVRPLLEEMQARGWSVDTVRFWGEERPVELSAA